MYKTINASLETKTKHNRTVDYLIRNIKNVDHWELSNSVLYDLCRKHPDHTELKVVIAKTLIIGRVYSATLERGNVAGTESGDLFYTKHVFPVFRKLFSSKRVQRIVTDLQLKKATPVDILNLHGLMVKALYGLRKLNKVSFCSKYLHFHYPESYFIIDSRAKYALALLSSYLSVKGLLTVNSQESYFNTKNDINYDYEKFYNKCILVRAALEKFSNRKWSIREFDTLLINIANKLSVKSE